MNNIFNSKRIIERQYIPYRIRMEIILKMLQKYKNNIPKKNPDNSMNSIEYLFNDVDMQKMDVLLLARVVMDKYLLRIMQLKYKDRRIQKYIGDKLKFIEQNI